jgi:hypothetical protein
VNKACKSIIFLEHNGSVQKSPDPHHDFMAENKDVALSGAFEPDVQIDRFEQRNHLQLVSSRL